MEEQPKTCRTPRKNPSPRKLVRIDLEPPPMQSTSSGVSESIRSGQLIPMGVGTCISPTRESNRTTNRRSTKTVSVDVKSKSSIDEDDLPISALSNASERCKESKSHKRKGLDRCLEPSSKRKKCEVADVGYSNAIVMRKSNKPASKSDGDRKSQIHHDFDTQAQLHQKHRSTEDSESQRHRSVVTAKSCSRITKQAVDLIDRNTETSSNSKIQQNSKMVSKDSSFERGSVCKRLFDVVNECQAKDRTVANPVLPEVLKNTSWESNNDSAVMDLSLKSPNFSRSYVAFSFPSTSKTELSSEPMNESCDVLDLSTAEADKFKDRVSSQSFLPKNADDFSDISESAASFSFKCEDSPRMEAITSSVVENLLDKNTEVNSSLSLSKSLVCTTGEEKEELVNVRLATPPSPSNCADLKQDTAEKQSTSTKQQESESQLNTHVTPIATDGIQQLADELSVLNQQSSNVATHMYRRLTPRRKRSFGIRQLSAGMLSDSLSSGGTPFQRFSRRTPSKSSPRVTPRRPDRTVKSPLLGKLIFASPTARNAIFSPLKLRTPSKHTAKRKLYSDSLASWTEALKPLASISKSESCIDRLSTTLSLELELSSNETASRNFTDFPNSPIDVPSTPDQLQIVEDENDDDTPVLDFEIDNILEEKSKKFVHLTAKNVRSIIHQVLTNENVKDIMRTALQEGSLKEQFQAAIFEPMLTRSKLKEVIEKGQIPPPFSRNPLKSSSKTFLDMNFPEEEDDEEYQPSKEELEHVSDEESVHSSHYGSPSVSLLPVRNRLSSSASDSDNTPCGTPMGPPAAPPLRSLLATDMTEEESNIALRTRSKLPLNDTPLFDIEASLVEPDCIPDLYDTECDEEDWAQFLKDLNRDFPCNDPLDDDMNDPEFDFLNEEENVEDDPEERRNDRAVQIPKKEVKELVSEILEEHEEYESLSELLEDLDEFPPASVEATDAMVSDGCSPCAENTPTAVDNSKVQEEIMTPSAEVNTGSNIVQLEARSEYLNASSLSGYPGHVPPLRMNPPLVSAFMHELIKLRNTDNVGNDSKIATQSTNAGNEWSFTPNELSQLKDQMRKHVQLLAQSYVQAWPQCHDSDLISLTDSSKETLVQLRELAQCSVVPYKQSYFYTPNLEEAIKVTNHAYERKQTDVSKILQTLMTERVMCQKMYQVRGLGFEQMEVFVTSRAFIFPQMLPEYRMESLEEGEKKFRVMFSEPEDNLLAMGLDQFGHLPNRYSLIRQYLLPSKTNDQLKYRYKNLKSKKDVMNPIRFLTTLKRLPDFQQYLDVEDEGSIVAPMDRDHDLLPKWFVAFRDAVQLHRKHQNLKPWSFCGVLGSYLMEHGNQFDNLAKLSKRRAKESDILPQRQTQNVMQIFVATPSALGSQVVTIADTSAINGSQPLIVDNPSVYITNPPSTYYGQPIIMANSSTEFTNQSVTFAAPSMSMSDSSVISSYACNNAGSDSVYQVVGTLYPMSSSDILPNLSTQMIAQEWPGMQVVNFEPQVTGSTTPLTDQGAVTATQVDGPSQQVTHIDQQITSSSMMTPNWTPCLVNQSAQMDNPNTQAEYASGANNVNSFALSTISGLPDALPVNKNTQDFVSGWDGRSAVPVSVGSSGNGFTSNPGSTCAQPFSHVVMEQSCSESSSFSLFSGFAEILSDLLPSASLTQPPLSNPSGVPVTTETYSRSLSVNFSQRFSSGCFSNPNSLHSEMPLSNTVSNREIPGCGTVTSVDAKIEDSWINQIASSAATTAVVLSTSKGSNSRGFQSPNSVVLSPTKVLSKLPDIPEPVLTLTREQLTQLGISVNLLSLPTVSTPKVVASSPQINRSMQESVQGPVIDEEVRDPVYSSSSSRLRSPEGEDDNSLLNVNRKDILNYAFAKAMGMSMSELQSAQEDNVSLISAEAETVDGQPRSELCFYQNAGDTEEIQELQATEEPLGKIVGQYFKGNETYGEIDKFPMQSENSMEIQENQTDPEGFSTPPMQEASSGCSVEISEGTAAEDGVVERQCRTVKDPGDNSVIDQSSFGFGGGFEDMLHNNCSLSSSLRHGVVPEPDENATLCTPKKYVVFSPVAETVGEDADHQSPDQSGFNSPNTLASLHSTTPGRSPLCHQWRSPPVRSSTTSLRTKRKSLGHISPIKFPLGNPAPSSASNTSLFAVKPSMRKRDRLGHRSLQPIAPRTFGVSASPLKSSIGSLRVKNKRKKTELSSVVRRILPKPGATATDQLPHNEIYSTPPSGKRSKKLEKNAAGDERIEAESSRIEQVESEGDEAPTTVGGCDMDSQTEEENEEELHLAELLEASTTIRVPPRGSRSHAPGNKAEQKKELALAMLAPDLVANDRLRDERDAMLARAYHCKVRKTLENDVTLYMKFLQLFVEFDQKCKTVEELYAEIKTLLSGYPELVSDFAGFLSPEQAVECQCLMTNYKFIRARTFMCKLEIYFQKHPSQLQKCMKAFKEWVDGAYSNEDLYNAVLPQIRSNLHLVDEFSVFFEDKKPPQSHLSKYEEVTLGESDDETQECDDYEKVDLSSQENHFGTANCPCRCHINGAELFLKKLRHCTSCGLKVIKGELYLQTSDKLLRPATVTFHRQDTNKDEIPDQSTGHKRVIKFKTSKVTSLKQKKSMSKKVKPKSLVDQVDRSMVMEPDSTSTMSPSNPENCSVAVETEDTDKSVEFVPKIDEVSSCHEVQMGSESQDGVAAQITVSSSNSRDEAQMSIGESQCQGTDLVHKGSCEIDTETPLSNAGSSASSTAVESSRECGSAVNQLDHIPCFNENITHNGSSCEGVTPVDGDSSGDITEKGCESREQGIERNFDIFTGVLQGRVTFEENNTDSVHTDQGSGYSETAGCVSQVERLADVETNTDPVHHQFNATTEVNNSIDSMDREEECQNENEKREGENESRGCENTSGSSATNQSSAGWKSEEDGLILKICQELDHESNALQVIVETLTHRTVEEVSDRLDFLMNMISGLNEESDASDTDDDSSDSEHDI